MAKALTFPEKPRLHPFPIDTWALAGVAITIMASRAKALDHRVSLFMDMHSFKGCPAGVPRVEWRRGQGTLGSRRPRSAFECDDRCPSPRAVVHVLRARKSAMSHNTTLVISPPGVNS